MIPSLLKFGIPVLVGALLLSEGRAQVGMMPDEKETLRLEETETNPFGRRGAKEPAVMVDDAETEETLIRDVLQRMTVTGVSDPNSPLRVLLGSYILEVGRRLPSVIENQTESLRVTAITPEQVELVFEEAEGVTETRTVELRYTLVPTIRYVLGSRGAADGEDDAETDGPFGGVMNRPEPSDENTP